MSMRQVLRSRSPHARSSEALVYFSCASDLSLLLPLLACRTGRVGTSRPVTTSGRFMRLGTASMLSQAGGPFIDVERLDLRKYAHRPLLARALMEYILYHEHK